jgi:hypothetical protein
MDLSALPPARAVNSARNAAEPRREAKLTSIGWFFAFS